MQLLCPRGSQCIEWNNLIYRLLTGYTLQIIYIEYNTFSQIESFIVIIISNYHNTHRSSNLKMPKSQVETQQVPLRLLWHGHHLPSSSIIFIKICQVDESTDRDYFYSKTSHIFKKVKRVCPSIHWFYA